MKYPLAARTTLVALVGLFSIHPAPAAPEMAGVSFSPPGVYGGATSTGTIRLPAAAPSGGLSIALASDNPQAVTIPASVTVPAGAKVVRFRLRALPVAVVTDVVIIATAGRDAQSGAARTAARQTARFRVAPPTAGWVKFSPNMVPAGAASTGTVFLTGPAPEGGQRVLLVSRDPSLVSVPDSITVPAGGTSAVFSAQTGPTRTRVGVTVVASVGGADKLGSSVLGLLPGAPAAPVGLSATPQWDPHCDPCDSMPMPEIALSWNAVSGASSYTLYRDGQPLQAGLTQANCDDMTVSSGHSYTYTVKAVNALGESAPSAPATAVAPFPAASLTAPANLSVRPFWDAAQGRGMDALSWSPVSGAVSYNLYQYDVRIAANVVGTTLTIPCENGVFGDTLSVTAVDSAGVESIPSAIAQKLTAFDPNNLPNWIGPWVPAAPSTLSVTPELNAGQPRMSLNWQSGSGEAFNIYRDGALIARGLTGLTFIDSQASVNEAHTYSVTGVNTGWPDTKEGSQSEAVTTAAVDVVAAVKVAERQANLRRLGGAGKSFGKRTGPRTAPHSHRFGRRMAQSEPGLPVVEIVQVVANDDSATVILPELPAGAKDWRVYDASNPAKVKYAGRRTDQTRVNQPSREPYAIEWNGINPQTGADLIAEAVDKLGPFQKMDGMAMMASGALNGQGDPSSVPNAVARSQAVHVTCQPRGVGRDLRGSQVFFDNFRNAQPFVPLPMPAPAPSGVYSSFYAHPGDYQELANDKWVLKNFGGDLVNSKFFIMDGHFMDTFYDGGGPNSPSPAHNNNASMILMPKSTADISGGKTLHVTFEVDSHFDLRRWGDVFVAEAGDLLVEPGKFADFQHLPTLTGNLFRWEIQAESHLAQLFGKNQDGSLASTDLVQAGDFSDAQSVSRILWDHMTPLANGTTQDLDKRHRFDLYLSQNRYRFEERNAQGNVIVVRDRTFPAGKTLPFTRCQVYFVHQVYHTSNDRPELMTYAPWETYWVNHRPWADERHWDNMGQEVLDTFPQ